MKYPVGLLVVTQLLAGQVAAKCVYFSSRAFFRDSETVVLASIVEAKDGAVPWPFGLEEEGTLPGRLLKLRVLKSWKGPTHVGETIDGWTTSPHVEDAYLHPDVGTQVIAFLSKKSPHEIMACNAVEPDRLDTVSRELDAITRPKGKHTAP